VSAAPSSPGPAAARGIVRLLNTAGGRALCLAGAVDEAVVESFLRRYGREPARVDVIDAGSVTSLSGAALELLRDHLDAAELAGRPLVLRRSPVVESLLPATIAGRGRPALSG
jgi:anti-anti-sigma regulatory factor